MRDKKEKRPGFISHIPEPDIQVSIDRNQFQPVINRGQDKCYKEIAHDGSKYKLEIIEIVISDISRNRYKRHSRNT